MPSERGHQKPIRLPSEPRTPGSGFARVVEPDAAVGTPTAHAPDQDDLADLIDTIRNDPENREGGEDVDDRISGETLTAIAAVVEGRTDEERARLLAEASKIEERMMRRFFRDEDRRSGSKMAHGHSQLAYEAALAAEVGARDFDLEAWKQMNDFIQLGVLELTPAELEARDRIKAVFIDPILTAVMKRIPGISQVLDPVNREYAVEMARIRLDAERRDREAKRERIQSCYDRSTGLLQNREFLRDMLRLEAKRFLREAGPDEVMVTVELDFVRLHDANTALGESVVDQKIINPFGAKLRHPRTLRTDDIKARVGRGDEFTIVLARINKEDVPHVLERLKAIVEEDSSKLDTELHSEILADVAYEREKLRSVRIKVRVGAKLWSPDEVRQWNMRDSERFIDLELRSQALDATHACKERGQDILIWDESIRPRDAEVPPESLLVERWLRHNALLLAEHRASQGPEANDKLEAALVKAIKENS